MTASGSLVLRYTYLVLRNIHMGCVRRESAVPLAHAVFHTYVHMAILLVVVLNFYVGFPYVHDTMIYTSYTS